MSLRFRLTEKGYKRDVGFFNAASWTNVTRKEIAEIVGSYYSDTAFSLDEVARELYEEDPSLSFWVIGTIMLRMSQSDMPGTNLAEAEMASSAVFEWVKEEPMRGRRLAAAIDCSRLADRFEYLSRQELSRTNAGSYTTSVLMTNSARDLCAAVSESQAGRHQSSFKKIKESAYSMELTFRRGYRKRPQLIAPASTSMRLRIGSWIEEAVLSWVDTRDAIYKIYDDANKERDRIDLARRTKKYRMPSGTIPEQAGAAVAAICGATAGAIAMRMLKMRG